MVVVEDGKEQGPVKLRGTGKGRGRGARPAAATKQVQQLSYNRVMQDHVDPFNLQISFGMACLSTVEISI